MWWEFDWLLIGLLPILVSLPCFFVPREIQLVFNYGSVATFWIDIFGYFSKYKIVFSL